MKIVGSTLADRARTDEEVGRLEARVQTRLDGRVLDFRLERRHDGLVLRGLSHSYYAKQLAQHAVMDATDLPIAANEIEVV